MGMEMHDPIGGEVDFARLPGFFPVLQSRGALAAPQQGSAFALRPLLSGPCS
jgi:hypothetical protein